MMTWQRGRELVTERRIKLEGPLPDFLDHLQDRRVIRVHGIAVFPHPSKDTTPLALRANLAHNHVLHQRTIIISGRTAAVPHIPWDQRFTVEKLGYPRDGVLHFDAQFGFQDSTDFPQVLRRALVDDPEISLDPDLDLDQATYFVSRITLRRTRQPGLATWRKMIFIALAHNAASQAEFLCLPQDRTVTVGSEVDV